MFQEHCPNKRFPRCNSRAVKGRAIRYCYQGVFAMSKIGGKG